MESETGDTGLLNQRIQAAVRITVGVLWLSNIGWKTPPDFPALRNYVNEGIDHSFFPPFTWASEHFILPNVGWFGWMTILLESALGAFLILGLCTRAWALIGAAQAAAIGMTVALVPGEWPWSYYLMIAVHLSIFAAAAGRTWGLDGLVRAVLRNNDHRWARLLWRAT